MDDKTLIAPDWGYHRDEIRKMRDNVAARISDYNFARAQDKVALPMARDNLSGAKESLRDAIAEARADFERYVVGGH